ncbi:C4-dicarboxylate transport sensor protein DctB [Defluviimonas aquaemixtae]|uniref:C4-dicarboxylate transport sensor protein DctB n=1 Tax=Albidovulum aquaemixtae TaxID=1542388 RepID=A0A2R8B698_9RHOB|nr:ATP-binding protein [Defluviimonas aquaemixtae]SPH18102.1 C4-dicarboxylate transport sensor protein DctB [Defluviimonas aquaemixtae]
MTDERVSETGAGNGTTSAPPTSADAPPEDVSPAPVVGITAIRSPWWLRLLVIAFIAVAVAVIWFTNSFLTNRFTESTRNRAEVRLALYTGHVLSELQRTSVVPLLLARDPALISSLNTGDFTVTSQRLISAQSEIGAASILLLDDSGRTVAATDRTRLGSSHAAAPYFVYAQRSKDTVFTLTENEAGGFDFTYSRAVLSEGQVVGVIVVGAELAKFERVWAGISDAVAVTDSEGRVILSTEPRWRGQAIGDALAARPAPNAIERAFQVTSDWANDPPDAYVRGEAVMRNEARIPFRGWKLISFTTYDSIRERVNTVLSLEIMGFAVLLSLIFYWLSRRARMQSAVFRRESAELRQLNARLQREIAEREKVQKDLAVAEQTLEQSSKLAALGEMSASVSHELNQPLAAMKTYLAGARLLLQRKRGEEALSSFQRIDDLIERMGAITRQLKSYARKGGEAFEPIDLRTSISSALAMMEPTLRVRAVRITRMSPREPVMVMADKVRLEQVIINLLRNALDATKSRAEPQIEILLTAGETATLAVRDNGHGIADLDNLFEPFYTTKAPGEGIGLGLAISSGIVNDLGGRLTARNAPGGGAVFEMKLPILNERSEAAE